MNSEDPNSMSKETPLSGASEHPKGNEVYQSFDSFSLDGIKSQLEVDTTNFFNIKPGLEDSLVEYVKKVTWKPGSNEVTANFRDGLIVQVGPDSQLAQDDSPENLNDETDPVKSLAAFALAKAKLSVVLDSLQDVFTTPPTNAELYLEALDYLEDQILKTDPRKNTSINTHLGNLSFIERFSIISTVVLAAILVSACAQAKPTIAVDATPTGPVASETSAVELSPTSAPTEAATSTTEPSATPEPSSTPEAENKFAEIDKRINEYLNAEGRYSEEGLSNLPHLGFSDREVFQGNYLGIMKTVAWINQQPIINSQDWTESSGTQVFFQAVFLGSVLENDRVVLYVGIKNKNGERIVVPLGKNIFPEEGDSPVNDFLLGNFDGGAKSIDSGFSNLEVFPSNANELANRFGEVVVIDCITTPITDAATLEGATAYFGAKGPDKIKEINNSVPVCRRLYNEVTDVRDGTYNPLDGTAENFQFFSAGTFTGISGSLDAKAPHITYDMLNFVRP